MNKNKILRIKAQDLRKKNINIKKITESFNKTGVIVIENILNKKKCKYYINLLEKINSRYCHLYFGRKKKKILSHSQNFGAKSVSNLHNKNINFLKFIDHPITLRLVNSFLKQGSYMESGDIICQAFEARSPSGKSKGQQLHNDARLIGSHFPLIVQVMWALDHFTKENGATRFVIGSHKFMKFPKNGKIYSGEKIIEVTNGSAIIFNGAIWHGSSKTNKSFIKRWGIICRYSRWFLKTSYDFQKNTPYKIYKKMNRKQKDLLGFRFNPPKDEFSGNRAIQKKYMKPTNYTLPI